jgi:hypothetical protein
MDFRKKFTTNLKDYTQFNFFHNRNKLIVLSLLLLIMAPLIWITVGVINLGENWWRLFTVDPSIYFIFILIIFLILLNFLQVRLISKKQYNSSMEMKVEKEVVIDSVGICTSNEFGNYSAGWHSVYKAVESKKAFYIYVSKLQAHIIPKKYITLDEADIIRSLIKQNLVRSQYRLREKKDYAKAVNI